MIDTIYYILLYSIIINKNIFKITTNVVVESMKDRP